MISNTAFSSKKIVMFDTLHVDNALYNVIQRTLNELDIGPD